MEKKVRIDYDVKANSKELDKLNKSIKAQQTELKKLEKQESILQKQAAKINSSNKKRSKSLSEKTTKTREYIRLVKESIDIDKAKIDTLNRQVSSYNTFSGAVNKGSSAVKKGGVASGLAGKASKNGALGVQELARAFEDVQFGIRGVLNNIPGMVTGFGGTIGLASVISITAVAADALFRNFKKFRSLTEDLSLEGLIKPFKKSKDLSDETVESLRDIEEISEDIQRAYSAVTDEFKLAEIRANGVAKALNKQKELEEELFEIQLERSGLSDEEKSLKKAQRGGEQEVESIKERISKNERVVAEIDAERSAAKGLVTDSNGVKSSLIDRSIEAEKIQKSIQDSFETGSKLFVGRFNLALSKLNNTNPSFLERSFSFGFDNETFRQRALGDSASFSKPLGKLNSKFGSVKELSKNGEQLEPSEALKIASSLLPELRGVITSQKELLNSTEFKEEASDIQKNEVKESIQSSELLEKSIKNLIPLESALKDQIAETIALKEEIAEINVKSKEAANFLADPKIEEKRVAASQAIQIDEKNVDLQTTVNQGKQASLENNARVKQLQEIKRNTEKVVEDLEEQKKQGTNVNAQLGEAKSRVEDISSFLNDGVVISTELNQATIGIQSIASNFRSSERRLVNSILLLASESSRFQRESIQRARELENAIASLQSTATQ